MEMHQIRYFLAVSEILNLFCKTFCAFCCARDRATGTRRRIQATDLPGTFTRNRDAVISPINGGVCSGHVLAGRLAVAAAFAPVSFINRVQINARTMSNVQNKYESRR
jgi:hypothetical protein